MIDHDWPQLHRLNTALIVDILCMCIINHTVYDAHELIEVVGVE